MKTLVAVVAGIYLLAAINQVSAVPIARCLPGDIIEITINKTEDANLVGYFVNVVNVTGCNSTTSQQLEDTAGDFQAANISCYNYTLTEAFQVAFSDNSSIALDQNTYSLTCDSQDFVNSTLNITVTVGPTLDTRDIIIDAPVEVTNDKNVYVLGYPVLSEVKLKFVNLHADDVRIAIDHMEIFVSGQTYTNDLIVDGCPQNLSYTFPTLTTTPANEAAHTIVVNHTAAILTAVTPLSQAVMVYRFLVVFCPTTDTTNCFVDDGCTLDGRVDDKVGRKRRQAGDPNTIVVEDQVLVFATEEEKERYINSVIEESGITIDEPEYIEENNEDEMCINKNVTMVTLAIVLAVIIAGIVFTLLMVWKIRSYLYGKPGKFINYANKGY